MTTETRYMVNVQWTVNGLTADKLKNVLDEGTSTGVSGYGVGSVTVTWGIRVWRRDSSGNETEITAGTPVAQVSRNVDGEGIQSNTWSCPATGLNNTDAIVVRVYDRYGAGGWNLRREFITEQLGAQSLDAATWTVYYHTRRTYDPSFDFTTGTYFYGDGIYYSRITGFTWTPAPAPAVGYSYGNGLVTVTC